jgi:oxygen-independent coproporphyrinogen-3 oxidase
MNTPAMSLYVHVPFCIRKCRYCDFYSLPYTTTTADAYIRALIQEYKLISQQYALQNAAVSTIFFGGGTPSMLSTAQWQQIHAGLLSRLRLNTSYEFTIECNPESFTNTLALQWLDMGVTRLTFGVQSLNDSELKCLGRPHTAQQALDVLHNPVLERFTSIGVDCMYGLPGQTIESLQTTLQQLCSIPVVHHLSAYELTLADATPFGRHKTLLPLPDDDTLVTMTRMVVDTARAFGFEQYEISNFAKPGFRCKHNEAYWHHAPYIGLGPAAHSYIHPYRWGNVPDVMDYCSMLQRSTLPRACIETLDTKALREEMIFLGLRTTDGINEDTFYAKTGELLNSGQRTAVLKQWQDRGLLEYRQPYWKLTTEGLMMADGLARDLM